MQYHEEIDYLDLMRHVLEKGQVKGDRTSVGSSTFVNSCSLYFDLTDGKFPTPNTRKCPPRIAFEETMFFLRGQTDSKILEEKKINIWKGNTSRSELDKKGLNYLPEGSIGKAYSHQWRNFGGDLGKKNGFDQVADMLVNMKKDPNSRRHLVTAWNPAELKEMALPPCHLLQMYTITPDGKLNSSFVLRSSDALLGLPYNIMSYALLNHIFAKYLGLEAGELCFFGHDVHIYSNQYDYVKELIEREPSIEGDTPRIKIKKDLHLIQDIMDLQWEDIEIQNYNPQEPLKTPIPIMAV